MVKCILNSSVTKIINYEFKDYTILEEALTHPQARRIDGRNQVISYERLEFVGDSVLNFVIALMLFKMFPEQREGALTKRKMDLVCGPTLTRIAKDIGLDKYIISQGSYKCTTNDMEDALEAVIGAIYIDGGLDYVERFIFRHWRILALNQSPVPRDPKSILQEWVQAQKLPFPKYELVNKTGPHHDPEFTMSVSVQNHGQVSASGSSKKYAEMKAAEKMLQKLGVTYSVELTSEKSTKDFGITDSQDWVSRKKNSAKPEMMGSTYVAPTRISLW